MSKFTRNLTIGFAAAGLLMAGSWFDDSRAETSGRNQQVAEASSATSRPDYQTDMEQRIDRASAEMEQIRSEASDATDEQIVNLEAAWDDVETGWADFQDAADDNWEEAKVALDQAWQDFETAWNDTFDDEGSVSQ